MDIRGNYSNVVFSFQTTLFSVQMPYFFAPVSLMLFFVGAVGLLSPALAQIQRSPHVHLAASDSLRTRLRLQSPKPDTAYVLALAEAAYSLRTTSPEQGVRLAEEAGRVADSLGFRRGKAKACFALGWCYFVQSRYPRAMEAYLDGEKAAELGQHIAELTQILQYKATLFRVLDNADRALQEHRRAERIVASIVPLDTARRMDIWQDIGIDLRLENKVDSALWYLSTILPYFIQRNDSVNIAITRLNLGECYLAQHRMDEALSEFLLTDTLARRLQYRRMLVFNGIALGKLYNSLNTPRRAIECLSAAIALAAQKNEQAQLKEAYRAIARSYALLGDLPSASRYTTMFARLQDSIYRENVRQNFALQQTNIATERREAELQRLHREQQTQRRFVLFLGIGIGVLLLGIVLLMRLVRAERRAKAEIMRQQELLQEQAAEIELVNTSLQEQNLELERTRESVSQMNAELAERNAALNESYSSIRVLSDIGNKITSTLDIHSVGMTLYEDINKLLKIPIMVVGTYLKNEGVIDYTLTIESGKRLGSFKLAMSETERPAVQCILQREPVIVQEFHQQALHGEAPQSLVYMPLISPTEEIIGVFSVQSYEKNFFTPQHLDILRTIVPFVTSALTNAHAYTALEEERSIVEQERHISETLLLNILPQSIAARLKSGERAIADYFESVTVLFADIVGFTNLSASTTPEELVQDLNAIFEQFDALAKKYGLEKIKTIGDAYMIAGGLPERSDDHCQRVARFALEAMHNLTSTPLRIQGTEVNLRMGIHTGAAVAGVIGTSKFAYDIWGDTVNTASRMESHGEAGKIHISDDVYRSLTQAPSTQAPFLFEERGEIEVKGKGAMRTWFLTGIVEFPAVA
ncbi:MAG: hypothetical protein EAZ92_13575 [Candidatus Kapaibacterium sp.]|nr:MAG: hypothetical protein EAZ92_13575 [Candidatus Kapabacteria bacterium]